MAEPETENVGFSLAFVGFSVSGGGTVEVAPRRHQGGTKEAAGRHQGGNATLDGPPYIVTTLLPTKNEVLKI